VYRGADGTKAQKGGWGPWGSRANLLDIYYPSCRIQLPDELSAGA